jgi:ATP-dependent RNA helicase
MKPGIQMPMLSATILLESFNPVGLFMENSVKILVKVEQHTQDAIAKFYVAIEENKSEMAAPLDIFGCLTIQKSAIFANRKEVVGSLRGRLAEGG